MKAVYSVLLSAFLAGAVTAADNPANFTKKPTAARTGDRVKIEFAVDRATDVAATCAMP